MSLGGDMWEECLREADNIRMNPLRNAGIAEKLFRMNFAIMNKWPFPKNRSFSLAMSCMAETMVGSALENYRVRGE